MNVSHVYHKAQNALTSATTHQLTRSSTSHSLYRRSKLLSFHSPTFLQISSSIVRYERKGEVSRFACCRLLIAPVWCLPCTSATHVLNGLSRRLRHGGCKRDCGQCGVDCSTHLPPDVCENYTLHPSTVRRFLETYHLSGRQDSLAGAATQTLYFTYRPGIKRRGRLVKCPASFYEVPVQISALRQEILTEVSWFSSVHL
jgi:hypothetical protein